MTPKGEYILVLHAHMPYVLAHGRWPHGCDWLSEVTAETYIPLLAALERLADDGISANITMTTTPVLIEQLSDPRFVDEFTDYVDQKIRAAEENYVEFMKKGDKALALVADMWVDAYRDLRRRFLDDYEGNIVQGFRRLQDAGHIETITCAATHGYLPLLLDDRNVQAQIRVGVETYEKHYGRKPRGIWLPECAYRPRYEWAPPIGEDKPVLRKGLEEFLHEEGIEYFIVDEHLIVGGEGRGTYVDRFPLLRKLWEQSEHQSHAVDVEEERSVHRAYQTCSFPPYRKTVAVYARDGMASFKVWSADFGFPGDFWYLDFHKKHFPGGLRYWRVTDDANDLGTKQPYNPARAAEQAREHAAHYVDVLNAALENETATDETLVVCTPFDAELFGHWWFEGVSFLEHLMRNMASNETVRPSTGGRFLDEHPPAKVISLPEGSWGEGGHHWVWLNDRTVWTWNLVYEAEKTMIDLAEKYGDAPSPVLRRFLEACARQLLLIESSDWQFVITALHATDYAESRITAHFADFKHLSEIAARLGEGELPTDEEMKFLERCETRDPVFEEINLDWWAKLDPPIEIEE